MRYIVFGSHGEPTQTLRRLLETAGSILLHCCAGSLSHPRVSTSVETQGRNSSGLILKPQQAAAHVREARGGPRAGAP